MDIYITINLVSIQFASYWLIDKEGPDQSSMYAQADLDLHCLHIELSCNSLNENILNICLQIQN